MANEEKAQEPKTSTNKLQDSLDAISFKNGQAKTIMDLYNDKLKLSDSYGRKASVNRGGESGIEGLSRASTIKPTLGRQFYPKRVGAQETPY
ncbi:MAG: hypothetical protein WCG95_09165 [bacterium]